MINGRVYDWQSVTVTLPTGVLVTVRDVSYEDELEKEKVYGRGPRPVGTGRGNYKASGKVTLLREEFEALNEYARQRKVGVLGLPAMPITVSYSKDGQATHTDTIKGVEFTKVGHKGSQGAKDMPVDLDFIAEEILRDGVPAF